MKKKIKKSFKYYEIKRFSKTNIIKSMNSSQNELLKYWFNFDV